MPFFKHLKITTLRRKILFLAVGSELIIIVVAALLGISHLSQSHEHLSQAMANSLSYSTNWLIKAIDSVGALSRDLYSDAIIQQSLSNVHGQAAYTQQTAASHLVYSRLCTAVQQSASIPIRFISVITPAFSTHSDSRIARQTPQDVFDELYREAVEAHGSIRLRTEWSDSYGLFLTRSIRRIHPFDLTTLGVVIICVDAKRMMDQATLASAFYGDMYFVLSSADRTFYRSSALPESTQAAISSQLQGDYGMVTISDHPYFVRCGRLDPYDWDYSCLVSYQEQQQSLHFSYLSLLGTLALFMILAVFLSGTVAHSISRQYTALVDKMRAFRGQRMEHLPDTPEETLDEVGLLHQQFDHMADEISSLIHEKYVGELLTKEAQLRALEAQVNPHFLYNVLESIHWRAQAAHQKDVCEIADALGSFLHISLNRQVKMLPLRLELELVQHYIVIQRYRFEDRLQYSQHVPKELLDVSMPKLFIQPLVENAVKYAVETSLDDECQIIVEACQQQDDLVITVRNSGSVMGDDLMESLRQGTTQPHGFGIGLTNIDSRLRLTYGEAYGLKVFDKDGYAVCQMRIPIHPSTSEKEAAHA